MTSEYARYLATLDPDPNAEPTDAYLFYSSYSPNSANSNPGDFIACEYANSSQNDNNDNDEFMYSKEFMDSGGSYLDKSSMEPPTPLNDPSQRSPTRPELSEKTTDEVDNSPIEIVAAAVSTHDDPTLPCLTFRFWVLGTFFTVLGAAISQVYHFRSNPLTYSVFFVQLMSYPIGVLMSKVLPTRDFNVLGLFRFSLNPGPFNVKEHLLIGVAASSGGTVAYAIDVIATNRLFFNRVIDDVPAIMLLISSQCIGYGIAGFLRSILVNPSSMIWPQNLVQVALYNTLHGRELQQVGTKRLVFFMVAFAAVFIYQLIPGFFMPIFSVVSVLCWVAPKVPLVQMLGSGTRGMGIGALSFDWNIISYYSPLYTPWWAQVNFLLGAILALWIAGPIMYLRDLWGAQGTNFISENLYNIEGELYDVQRVLFSNFTLNPAKMAAYSPLRMSPFFAASYGLSFMMISATVMHVFLYYRSSIMHHFKSSKKENEDIHVRMMRVYERVPNEWYGVIFVMMLIVSIVVCEMYLDLPWWGLVIAVIISILLSLPIGIIQAISNNQIGLNVLTELIYGYIRPGSAIGNTAFKTYGYMTMSQCLLLVSDLKLGHYMKIPPRSMFITQLYGTILGAIANYFTMLIIFGNRLSALRAADGDSQEQPRGSEVFYAASIIWGAFGPGRIFGPNSPYRVLYWFFLLGFLLPLPFYFLHLKYPRGKWHLVNIPIITLGAITSPTSPANFIISTLIVSFIFQFYLYRCQHIWWRKYNYVLSAALDAGTEISALFVYFIFIHRGASFVTWWGNPPNDLDGCNMDLVINADA